MRNHRLVIVCVILTALVSTHTLTRTTSQVLPNTDCDHSCTQCQNKEAFTGPAIHSVVVWSYESRKTDQRTVGSGVQVTPELVLTNSHVCTTNDIVVFLRSGEQLRGQIVNNDPAEDLALIRLERSAPQFIPYSLEMVVLEETPVVITGSPSLPEFTGQGRFQMNFARLPGQVIREVHDNKIVLSAPGPAGTSGGGVWTQDGKLLALYQGYWRRQDQWNGEWESIGLSWAISAKAVERFLVTSLGYNPLEKETFGRIAHTN